MKTGKKIRLQRFLYPQSENGLIVPLDHGLTMGPLPGIRSVQEIGRWIKHPAITGVIVHKGMAERLSEHGLLDGKGLMIHLNGMSTLSAKPDTKVSLTTVEAALRLGADAVSLQVNFDGTNDEANLEMIGRSVDAAARYELPILAMVYDKVKADEAVQTTRISHLARIAMELGCDAVKIGEPLQMKKVLRDLSQDMHVFVAGGGVVDEKEIISLCRRVVSAGGAGLCVGRNVFQLENAGEVLSSLREVLLASNRAVSEIPLERGLYGIH